MTREELDRQLAAVTRGNKGPVQETRCDQCYEKVKVNVDKEDADRFVEALAPLIGRFAESERIRTTDCAINRVRALPGPNGEGIAKWPERHQEVYLLALEEAVDQILIAGEAADGRDD